MQGKVIWKKKRGSSWRVGLLLDGQEPAVFVDSSQEPPEPGETWELPEAVAAQIGERREDGKAYAVALLLALAYLILTDRVPPKDDLLRVVTSMAESLWGWSVGKGR